jgi:hypothetical protein
VRNLIQLSASIIPEGIKMEQRLRLVQGTSGRPERRITDRQRIAVPGQILWKDAKGHTRMMSVVTREISEMDVTVECVGGVAIPLYRMVYFQIDREARHRMDLPGVLRKSSVLSAIFRVGACSDTTGAPTEYGLRMLVEPKREPAAPDTSWTESSARTA